MKFLGDSVKGSLSSAVQVMRDVKSLEAADAQIAGQKAQALTSVAMANNANASARATDAGLASIKGKPVLRLRKLTPRSPKALLEADS